MEPRKTVAICEGGKRLEFRLPNEGEPYLDLTLDGRWAGDIHLRDGKVILTLPDEHLNPPTKVIEVSVFPRATVVIVR